MSYVALNRFAHKMKKRMSVFSMTVVLPEILAERNGKFYLGSVGRISRGVTFILVIELKVRVFEIQEGGAAVCMCAHVQVCTYINKNMYRK